MWLRLLHRQVASLCSHGRNKLGPKFFGPLKILEHIGDIAYGLQLPTGSCLSMMSSMLAFSRSFLEFPLMLFQCFHQYGMAVFASVQKQCSRVALLMAGMNCLFVGMVCLLPMFPRCHWMSFVLCILLSGSRKPPVQEAPSAT